MYDFSWYYKKYGIKPMTLKEELNMPKAAKQTRNNKIKMIGELEWIVKIANQEIDHIRMFPEENNQQHADLVQKYADIIHTAFVTMEDVLRIGR